MVAAEGHEPELAHHHRLLLANCLAENMALSPVAVTDLNTSGRLDVPDLAWLSVLLVEGSLENET